MATQSASSPIDTPLATVESSTPHSVMYQQLVSEADQLDCGMGGESRLETGKGDDGIGRQDSELLIDAQDDAAAQPGDSRNNLELGGLREPCLPQPKHLIAGKNNSSQDKHHIYVCPAIPERSWPIGDPVHVELRSQCRMCLRPDRHKYVTLNFRVMRHDSEIHVGQIVNLCGVKRNALYTPIILDRWTRTLRIKIKATVKIALVFNSVSARLGLRGSVGLKCCLDGFYGIEAFGDAFGNFGPGICPWMEVTGDASPISLKLEDNDNIYISIATEKMIENARTRIDQAAEQAFKNAMQRSEHLKKSRVSFMSLKSEDEEENGRTSYLSEEPININLD